MVDADVDDEIEEKLDAVDTVEYRDERELSSVTALSDAWRDRSIAAVTGYLEDEGGGGGGANLFCAP